MTLEVRTGDGDVISLILLAYHSTQPFAGILFAALARRTFAKKQLQYFPCIVLSACLIEGGAQSLVFPLSLL